MDRRKFFSAPPPPHRRGRIFSTRKLPNKVNSILFVSLSSPPPPGTLADEGKVGLNVSYFLVRVG